MVAIGRLRCWLTLGFLISLPELAGAAEDELTARAREIHARVFTLDSHVDIPFDFASAAHDPATAAAQVNLDSMAAGGLDGAFFIVYVGQGGRDARGYETAARDALTKFEAIHRMTERYPQRIGLARTAAEARALHAEGRLVAMIGIENGYVIGRDPGLLADYRERGARYMTLVHNGHNDLGDSAQPQPLLGDLEAEHGGLSSYGAEVVAELNRLGILVDVSHVSRQTMLDAIRLSAAPVIASHSSVAAVHPHPRNLDDEQLLALRDNGGVVQIVAFGAYVTAARPATVSDFIDHVDHAVDLIGIEHVGIASDFGGGGGVEGWNGAAETFNVTLELLRRGYGEEEIALLWSGNLLRVLEEAERVSASFADPAGSQ